MESEIQISGMRCVSCEILLRAALLKVKGVTTVKISHKKGMASVVHNKIVTRRDLEKVIVAHGYGFVTEGKLVSPRSDQEGKIALPDLLEITVITLVLLFLAYLGYQMNISSFFPDLDSGVSVAVALLIGLVASVSTCLAVTGGIVMSFGSLVPIKSGQGARFCLRARPHFYFHLGRLCGFAVLGGLLGLIGSQISYSLAFTGYLSIGIALVMFYIGLQILNFVPPISRWGFHLPDFFSAKISNLQRGNNNFFPLLIGLLTFFLPCGFTQSMQLAAVASQNPVSGALIMFFFALGTTPVLFAIGLGSTYARREKFRFFQHLIGVIIVFFSLFSLNAGLSIIGAPLNLAFFSNGNNSAASSQLTDRAQIVKMDVDWVFKPAEFRIKSGIPVRWEIQGKNVSGCSGEIIVPALNIRRKIATGLNIIEFIPAEKGILPFSCWMGMVNGRFIVE